FSVSADTLLAEAVNGLQTVLSSSGSHKDDSKFLKSLKFGHPERMYAIPLVARGRGVAVLYADSGPEGQPIAIEAIEVLVRVAGLTVELLASAPVARPGSDVSHETESVSEPAYQMQEDVTDFAPPDPQEDLPVEEIAVEEEVQEVEFTPPDEQETVTETDAA